MIQMISQKLFLRKNLNPHQCKVKSLRLYNIIHNIKNIITNLRNVQEKMADNKKITIIRSLCRDDSDIEVKLGL